jgi:hypothetical protein
MSIITARATITKALASWAASKSLPLSREQQAFTKPANNGTYLELNIIPAKTILASIDGERKRYLGTVIINIWTKDNQGTGEAEKLAEELANLFSVVPKKQMPVSVEEVPHTSKPVPDGSGYSIMSVKFPYRLEV